MSVFGIHAVFGSLGYVYKLVTRGLRRVGFSKMKAKQLAKDRSISYIVTTFGRGVVFCHDLAQRGDQGGHTTQKSSF